MDKDLEFDFGELMPEFLDENNKPVSIRNIVSYSGPERRIEERRSTDDRRAHFRFQPGKCIDRRECQERRRSVNTSTH